MKRYKQTILSNFFVITNDDGIHHLVEANLDIESRDDRTLCTEVLQGTRRYEVLTSQHFPEVCMICAAILDRRIGNMPKERKLVNGKSDFEWDAPKSQMCLLTVDMNFDCEEASVEVPEEQSGQFKLLL